MKIIDLLCLISLGKEVPKYIKYKDDILEYDEDYKMYMYCRDGRYYDDLFDYFTLNYNDELDYSKILNIEVEVKEKDKKIEKIDLNGYNDISTGIKEEWMSGEDVIIVKINELIDKVNSMEDK